MNINTIFAKSVIEVWRERIDNGECTLYEAECGLKKARDNCSEKTGSGKVGPQ